MTDSLNRRDLLKQALVTGAGIAAASALAPTPAIAEPVTAASAPDATPSRAAAARSMRGVPFERRDTVRFGIVGTGLRGRSLLSELLAIDGVQIVALADIAPEKAARAVKM